MEAMRISSIPSLHIHKSLLNTQFANPLCLNLISNQTVTSLLSSNQRNPSKSKLFSSISSSASSAVSTEPTNSTDLDVQTKKQDEKFDWFSQWYPVMPVCDLDKRAPHAKRVLGLDVVVWWDRNENAWKVFDDSCPHRLAPLSEGRIDRWGRLQCVYHGWCFNGSGDCKFIPQAPPDGPTVHTFKKACATVYPSTVHHNIVWFWPNADPQYQDIILKKQPPYLQELEDPSYSYLMGNRDIPYGYEILVENLMDPAHVPYAHYGIMGNTQSKNRGKADREGGRPLEMSVQTLNIDGFTAKQGLNNSSIFMPPCVFYAFYGSASTAGIQRRMALIFICIPVSPGKSRLIWAFPRNFAVWVDKVVPRWMFHVGQNLILDSDLYLLHLEERKIMEVGPTNWQKACFVPTKSDALVVGFRKWLNKYAGGGIDWRFKFNESLPPSPPKEQLMDRYWSHVVNCTSCNAAHKALQALEVVLQVFSIVSIGIVAATNQSLMPVATRAAIVSLAVLFFAASKWLSHFIYKNFHFHDYNHAFR